MSTFSRTLIITNDLERPATLVFSFDDQLMGGIIYRDYFPTVFRVIPFPAGRGHSAGVTYKNQLAFTSPQIVNEVVVPTAIYRPISLGQVTDLVLANGGLGFTPPTIGPPGVMQARNRAGRSANIGVGFFKDEGAPFTALVFPQVPFNSNVVAQFTPKLRAYVTTHYQENNILRVPIPSPVIWQENLATLPQTTAWTFRQKPDGEYQLVPREAL